MALLRVIAIVSVLCVAFSGYSYGSPLPDSTTPESEHIHVDDCIHAADKIKTSISNIKKDVKIVFDTVKEAIKKKVSAFKNNFGKRPTTPAAGGASTVNPTQTIGSSPPSLETSSVIPSIPVSPTDFGQFPSEDPLNNENWGSWNEGETSAPDGLVNA